MMLNKKGVAVGLSPLKFLIAFFIIIPLLIVLLIAFSLLVDSHSEKTNVLVSSALAKDVWLNTINKKINDKSMIDILEDCWSAQKAFKASISPSEIFKTQSNLIEKDNKVAEVCRESFKEILPQSVTIKRVVIYHFDEPTRIICGVFLESSLSKKNAKKSLEASGFVNGKISHTEEKIRQKEFGFGFTTTF